MIAFRTRLFFAASPLLALAALASGCSAGASPDGSDGKGDKNDDGGFDFGDQDAPPGCGDGTRTDDEACDDGNREDGDGCAENCLVVEPGFICREAGLPCEPYAKCGDGILSFPEQCDDAESDAAGCSPTCKIEIGFKCDGGSPSSCSPTDCGDSIVEGAEGCDDGNALPNDGCDANCQWEPVCTSSGCTSSCGDGIVLGDEGCDDGNLIPGDGCSATCTEEDGYTCGYAPCEEINGECVLRVPVVYRDFPDSHVDMEVKNYGAMGSPVGMVETYLDANKKPVLVPANAGGVTAFHEWWTGASSSTGPFADTIPLFDNGGGGFVNRYLDDGTRWEAPLDTSACQRADNGGLPCPKDGNPYFFPLDDVASPADTVRHGADAPTPIYGGNNAPKDQGSHNFNFTSEVTYWFVYQPDVNAMLTFIGDDDVFVFINGRLAVDLGAKHEAKGGRVEVGATSLTTAYTADGNQDGTFDSSLGTVTSVSEFGLVAGNAYEIKIFHAERETVSSSFQLTLAGFNTSRSECSPACGDGIIGFGEECDDGPAANGEGYNNCQADCTLAGYCGDGVVQEDEQCDHNAPDAPANCQGCNIVVVK